MEYPPVIKTKSLWIAAIILGAVIPEISGAASPVPGEPKFTSQQIHNYALALLQIQQVGKASLGQDAARSAGALPTSPAPANVQIAQILDRRDLDNATFNAISSEVKTHRSLRRQVRQTMMQELIGF